MGGARRGANGRRPSGRPLAYRVAHADDASLAHGGEEAWRGERGGERVWRTQRFARSLSRPRNHTATRPRIPHTITHLSTSPSRRGRGRGGAALAARVDRGRERRVEEVAPDRHLGLVKRILEDVVGVQRVDAAGERKGGGWFAPRPILSPNSTTPSSPLPHTCPSKTPPRRPTPAPRAPETWPPSRPRSSASRSRRLATGRRRCSRARGKAGPRWRAASA